MTSSRGSTSSLSSLSSIDSVVSRHETEHKPPPSPATATPESVKQASHRCLETQRELPPSPAATVPEKTKQTDYRRSTWLTMQDFLNDCWYGEIMAMIFSLVCFCAIAILLRVYENKPVPLLPHGLTLNAMVSVLATGSKSALLFSVASNIGQWKWIWYREQKMRKLSDLQVFDDASRGPLGAIQLLLEKTRTSIGLLGAAIVLLALVYDPFVQQVLAYPVEEIFVPSNLTWTLQAQVYPSSGPSYISNVDMAQMLSVSLHSALWPASTSPYERAPACASTNCTWDPLPSLGFCSTCADVSETSQIQNCSVELGTFQATSNSSSPADKDCYVEFGSSGLKASILLSLSAESTGASHRNLVFPSYILEDLYHYDPVTVRRTGAGATPNDNQFLSPNNTILGVRDPLLVLGDASFQIRNNTLQVDTANLCTLDLCLREYDISVTNAGLQRTSQKRGVTGDDPFQGIADLVSISDAGSGISTHQGRDNFVFCYDALGGKSGASLPAVFASHIMGNITTIARYYSDDSLAGLNNSSPNGFSSDQTGQVNALGVSTFMDNAAQSLTKLAMDMNRIQITGKAGNQVTFVHVRWLWLITPGLLEITGLVLLILTIRISKRRDAPLWKSSILPILFHSLQGGEGVLEVPNEVGRMLALAKGIEFMLEEAPLKSKLEDSGSEDVEASSGK